VGTKEHVVVMNREDMISPAEKRRWRRWFVSQGENVIYTDARLGTVCVGGICRPNGIVCDVGLLTVAYEEAPQQNTLVCMRVRL
jgi:hypothetical protein